MASGKEPSLWPLALLGTAFVLLSLRKPPAQSDKNNHKTISPQNTTDPKGQTAPKQLGFVSNTIPPPQQTDYPDGGKKRTPGWEKAAVVVAFFILGVNAWQSWETRKSAGAAKSAADEARLGRIQNETSFKATVEQFRQDQRAWVPVRSVKLTTPYTPTQMGEITVEITNTGKTPALNLRVATVGYGTSENLEMHPMKPIRLMVVAPSTPGDDIYVGLPTKPDTTKIYIKFVLHYWDVFQKPSDPPHSTTFCGFYPSGRGLFLANCDKGASMN